MGAAGRDFHNFNVYFRGNPDYRVLFFTAAQIPDIAGRRYPPELAGPGYEDGIPIYPEADLPRLIASHDVDEVVFAYSDVPHEYVMHKASMCAAAGADFRIMGPKTTMLKSTKPVIAVTAVRTGVGKSQTTRRVADILVSKNRKVGVVRHPMPYGDLLAQAAERFATYEDMDIHKCTIEEREEYEPIVDRGLVVWAGVDYERILRGVEAESDIILWDGGNNDIPFYRPDIHIVLVDPHRPGHEERYHPGETNLRMADIIVINKVDTASPDGVERVRESIDSLNPDAIVVEAASPIFVDNPEVIRGKKVLVIEDGPTLTHGEMTFGAGVVAAKRYRAESLVDPREYAVKSILETYRTYPRIGTLLPAMGYGEGQVRDLEETIRKTPCDGVVVATPIDLSRIAKIDKPWTRVRYELQEIGRPTLQDAIDEKAKSLGLS
ncbi:MAG TPA: GTPase [Firmicutes bacterium]|nr:GTPase [Candidatus Fermentithermobacillaceae bacterium]